MKKLTFFLCAVFLTMIGFAHGSEPYASLENATGDGNGTFSSYQGLTWSPTGQLTWNENSSNRVLAGPGDTCLNPAVITSLPFTVTDNTVNYGDDYSSGDKPPQAPGAVGNPSSSYLGGDDVVYAYTPSANGVVNISVSNHATWVGVFVFTGCSPFEWTVGGATTSSATTTLEVNSLPVNAGETYYIIISTFPSPQSTSYTLSVVADVFDCPELEANIGSPCDDGNSQTYNDTVNANCECAGILYDCPALEANYGDACDRGNGEVGELDENCECIEVQCQNTSKYPSAVITPNPTGASTTISTCQYWSEYSEIGGIISGFEYEFDSVKDGTSAFVTVRIGSVGGPVLASGFGPLTVTASSNDNLFVHWNDDAVCGTSSGCAVSTVSCVTCATAVDCEGVPGGPAQPGTACDDGDPNTYNDVYDANCNCAGALPGEGSVCATAIAVDCNADPVTYSSAASIGTNTSSCSMGNKGLWFSFMGTGADITVNSTATFDHEMSINTGTCDGLTNVGCKDGSTGAETYTITSSVANQMYYVYIAHYSSGNNTTGNITISLVCATPPECVAPTMTVAATNANGGPIEGCLEAGGEYYVLATLSGGQGNTSYNVTANSGTPVEVAANGSHSFGPFTVGTNVSVTAVGAQDGDCSVSATQNSPALCPPSNVTCDSAAAMECGAQAITYSSVGSLAVAPAGCTIGKNGIWFSFTGTGGDISIVSTASFDHKMSIQTGSCGALTWIACQDLAISGGTETYTVSPTIANQMYYVYVAQWSSSSTTTGSITIGIDCASIPECVAPTMTVAATNANGVPIEGCLEAGGEYYVMATLTGGEGNSSYNVTANGGDPVEVAANGSHIFGPYTVGTNVNLTAVGAQDGDCSVSATQNSPAICPPSNDDCANAISLECGQPISGSTVNATASGLLATCGSYTSSSALDVFYSFVADGTSDYTVSLDAAAGNTFDGILFVYSGVCGDLTSLGCSDSGNPETIDLVAPAAGTYIVRLFRYTASGNFTLSLECTAAPECTAPELTLAAQDANGGAIEGCLEEGSEYYVLAALSGGSGNTSYIVSANGGGSVEVPADGSTVFGPFIAGTDVSVTATGEQNGDCSVDATVTSPAICGASSDCLNTSQFGSANVSTPGVKSISTCQYFQEYSVISGVNSGYEYQFTGVRNSDSSLAYITVRSGTFDGPVVGEGFSPLNVTSTSSDNLYVHYNTDANCGTGTGCATTTAECITCGSIPDCEGVPGGTALPGTSCDDGDPNTINDVYDANCNCAGELPAEGSVCSSALPLECSDGPVTYSSEGSNGTNITSCTMGDNGLWFSFMGTGADITINSTATFDHEMSINTGTCDELEGLGCVDNSLGAETFTISSSVDGQMYYVYIARYNSGSTITGDITISIDCAVIPECTAPELTLAAQDANGAPIEGCIEAGGEYYVLASLSGGSGNTSYNVSVNDGDAVEVDAEGSQIFGPYSVGTDVDASATGVQDGACTASASLDSPAVCGPANDDCDGAIPLSCGDSVAGTTYGATNSGLGYPSCASGTLNDVFYTLDLVMGNEYTVTVVGDDYDAVLAIYSGSCGSLTEIACADNGFSAGQPETITWTATATETVVIRTYDWSSSMGTFTISVDCTPVEGPCGEGDAFVTTWMTSSPNESITIPTYPGEAYSYTVDWGDGNTSTDVSGDATHMYADSGMHTVSICGAFPRIYFNNTAASRLKLRTIEQWGTGMWTSMNGAFAGAENMVSNATDMPDLSMVTDMYGMFAFARSFNGDLMFGNWDVSGVTNMYGMFAGASVFNYNINGWDVGNVTTMENMFYGATEFNQPLNAWNVNSVTNMYRMFGAALNFNQDISGWGVSNVTTMEYMFAFAIRFDQNLGDWTPISLTKAQNMFKGVKLSTANYDGLLMGWSTKSLKNNVKFSGGNSNYCAGQSARQFIIATYNWNITDGGLDCTPPFAGDTLDAGNNGPLFGVSLYPNPMQNEMILGNPKNVKLENISVYDLTGRLVQSVNLKGMSSEMILDVSKLSSATYMVLITGEDGGQISRLMIKE